MSRRPSSLILLLPLLLLAGLLAACRLAEEPGSSGSSPLNEGAASAAAGGSDPTGPSGVVGAVLWNRVSSPEDRGQRLADEVCARHGLQAEIMDEATSGGTVKTSYSCRQ